MVPVTQIGLFWLDIVQFQRKNFSLENITRVRSQEVFSSQSRRKDGLEAPRASSDDRSSSNNAAAEAVTAQNRRKTTTAQNKEETTTTEEKRRREREEVKKRQGRGRGEVMKIMCLKNTKNVVASRKSAFSHVENTKYTTFSSKKKKKKGLIVKRSFSFFFFIFVKTRLLRV